MLNVIRFCIPIVIYCTLGSLITAQSLLPGQLPRQSLSGGILYRCLFDRLSDAEDGDGFPDYWTRKSGFDNGVSFPAHLRIGNVAQPNPFGNFALRMEMDGGAGAVFSPKIPVRAGMSYTISAYVEANNLEFDEVSIIAAFYGHDATTPIYTAESTRIRNTNGWQKLVIGPFPVTMPNVQSVAVGLLVMPTTRQDYGSQVNFTNVEIKESPSVALEMANENHLFFSTREINVQCHFRGLDPAQHSVRFILEDPFGRIIGQRSAELMIGNRPAARFVVTPQQSQDVILGTATWQNIPIRSPGFYRIRVATPEEYIQTLRLPPDQTFDDPLNNIEPLTFVVMPPDSYRPGGDFGWTLDGWTFDEITQALPTLAQSGLAHLKIPAWITQETPTQQRETLIRLCRTLAEQQVHLIGLLNPVPESIRAKIPYGYINAAAIFENNSSLLRESLQPTLRTLSLLVKDWQWTSDTDQSLINLLFDSSGQMLPSEVARFQTFQQAFDQDQFGFGIGMTWNWNQDLLDDPLPITNVVLNYPMDSSITPEEAVVFLDSALENPLRHSVSLSPLPADNYSLDTRITALVRSLVLLKAAGLTSIFLTAPKDEQTGVLRKNGTPNELYLPWRQAATLLSGSRFLGSITLPNRSRNYCFEQENGQCLMIIWHDGATPENPVIESLYLGNEPEIIDVWGKHVIPDQLDNNQIIPVTQTPTFISGLNIDVMQFRLSMQSAVKSIPAVPGRANTIPLIFKNDTAFPVSIQITPQSPQADDWTFTPPSLTTNLEAGLAGEGTFDLTLSRSADTGKRLFQYNVKITGIDAPEFMVYDEMMVGNPDVFMEFTSRLKDNGDIELIQVFTNNSDKALTYNCRLTVPNRPLMKSSVTRQGFGIAEYVYTIRRGKQLLENGSIEAMLRADPVNDGSGNLGEPMVYTIPLVRE